MSNTKVEAIFCNFLSSTSENNLQYLCYGKEVCCENGCCMDGARHFYQTWYYWCLLLIALGLASASSWLCKKPPSIPNIRNDTSSQTHSYHYENIFCNREYVHNFLGPRNCEERNDDVILDRLVVSFKNKKLSGSDPPSYNSIFEMEQKPSTSVAERSIPPPSYTSTNKEKPRLKISDDRKHQKKNIDNSSISIREE